MKIPKIENEHSEKIQKITKNGKKLKENKFVISQIRKRKNLGKFQKIKQFWKNSKKYKILEKKQWIENKKNWKNP